MSRVSVEALTQRVVEGITRDIEPRRGKCSNCDKTKQVYAPPGGAPLCLNCVKKLTTVIGMTVGFIEAGEDEEVT